MAVGKLLLGIGVLFLAHAALSAVQHRSFLKLTDDDYTGLPTDISVECLIGGLLSTLGVVWLMGVFKDIRVTTELNSRTLEIEGNKHNFMTFNHRGRILHQFVGKNS